MTSGVFGLKKVYKRQYENVKNNNFASWPESGTYGYYVGGANGPTRISNITRLDFSNETVSDPGKNLSLVRSNLAGTQNNSYGYFGGGSPTAPTIISTITRLDFSNETVSDPGKNFSSARSQLEATQNSSYGYFGGGYTPGFISTITRLDFSNETVSDPGNNLSSARVRLATTSSSSYGYFGGGSIPNTPAPTVISTIIRLDFSNETVSDPGKNLPIARNNLTATSSSSYGYFGGGETAALVSTITRLDFSNDNISDLTNNLPFGRSRLSTSSSIFYGYFGGGFNFGVGTFFSNITRLDFSNETVSNPGKNLPFGRSSTTAVSGGASVFRGNKTYGYFAGGSVPNTPIPTVTSIMSRLDFSNETTSDLGNTLPSARDSLAATSSNSYGYFAGGYTFVPPSIETYFNILNRLDFSNETVSDPGNNLSTQSSSLAAVSSSSYGYFGGGFSPTLVNSITRLDFSNETVSDPGNNLPSARNQLAATSSNSYGYFGGGNNPEITTITRLDLSNETVSNPGNNLPSVRRRFTATSSNSYGYFGGGYYSTPRSQITISVITRLDFSNDTVSDPGNNLPSARNQLAATSSNSYGYFGGGSSLSLITRLDFSNETVSDPSNNLPTARSSLTATSNSN